MGCGFCAIVAAGDAERAAEPLARHHPGARPIGTVTSSAGRVECAPRGVAGDRDGLALH
jgi:phosphoribosylformylglycinamidine cyclo-ligase